MESDLEFMSFDGDACGVLDAMREALPKLGVHMYDDPRYEGTDMYGVILSKRKLTKREIRNLTRDDNEPR